MKINDKLHWFCNPLQYNHAILISFEATKLSSKSNFASSLVAVCTGLNLIYGKKNLSDTYLWIYTWHKFLKRLQLDFPYWNYQDNNNHYTENGNHTCHWHQSSNEYCNVLYFLCFQNSDRCKGCKKYVYWFLWQKYHFWNHPKYSNWYWFLDCLL